MKKENISSFGQFADFVANSLLTKFLLLPIAAVTTIMLARLLGPEIRGQFALLLLIPTLTVTFGRFGIAHSVNYYAGKTSPDKLIVNSIFLSFLIGVLLLLLALPVVLLLRTVLFKGISEKLLVIMVCCIPLFLLEGQLMGLLQGLYKIKTRNVLQIMQAFIYLTGLFLLLNIFHSNIHGAVLSWILSECSVLIASSLFLVKEVTWRRVAIDVLFLRDLFSFGFKSHIGNIFKDLNYRVDFFLVGYFMSPIFVGYYAVAVNIAEIIWKIPDAIGSVLLPKVARMDSKDSNSFVPAVARMVFIPVCILCFVILFFSKYIVIYAFGKEYLPSDSALVFLLPGIMVFAQWKIFANALIAIGRPLQYSITSFISLIMMIILDIILIPLWGIRGAALASTVSYIIATGSIGAIYAHVTGNKMMKLFIPVGDDILRYKKVLRNISPIK